MGHWYREAILAAARDICDQGLLKDPNKPHLLHGRGLLALRDNDVDTASFFFRRAIAADATQPVYFIDLGELLATRGCYAEAEHAYRQAIALAPSNLDVHRRLGKVLVQQGRLRDSSLVFQHALELNPRDARTLADWGDALTQSEPEEAIKCYEQALELEGEHAEWYGRLGRVRLLRREWQLSWHAFTRGLSLDPERVELHIGCGDALLGLGSIEQAAEAFQAALLVDPRNVEVLKRLLGAFELLGRRVGAAGIWFSLGRAFESRHQREGARVAYGQALTRKPDHLKALVALGSVHLHLGSPWQAVECFEKALAIRPDHDKAHRGMSEAAALVGDLERHWSETAWFNRFGAWKNRHFEQRAWDGRPVEGRTILLWTNERLGDTILLVRFAEHVKARGARVVVECEADLVPLLAQMACLDGVSPKRTPLPPFDMHAILPSLPRLLNIGVQNIPSHVPYIEADTRLARLWRDRIDPSANITIGLALSSDAVVGKGLLPPSVTEVFGTLPDVSGYRFLCIDGSLAVHDGLTTPTTARRPSRIASRSLASTAALLVNLDLVVTSDLTIAHLAGAMGRPVWTLLPLPPSECRWLMDGEVSPWYPTMRLFRQTRRGDWADVIDRVRTALESWTTTHGLRK